MSEKERRSGVRHNHRSPSKGKSTENADVADTISEQSTPRFAGEAPSATDPKSYEFISAGDLISLSLDLDEHVHIASDAPFEERGQSGKRLSL